MLMESVFIGVGLKGFGATGGFILELSDWFLNMFFSAEISGIVKRYICGLTSFFCHGIRTLHFFVKK